jgi:hypothetical protein
MDVDGEKLEQVVLALLHMNSFKEADGRRAWKSLPWTILDSLHEKGYISDPANKNKSVWLTDEGAKLSEEVSVFLTRRPPLAMNSFPRTGEKSTPHLRCSAQVS